MHKKYSSVKIYFQNIITHLSGKHIKYIYVSNCKTLKRSFSIYYIKSDLNSEHLLSGSQRS